MLESLNLVAYATLGFITSYLALEGGWYFTACKIKEKSIPPCVFKQLKTMLTANNRIAWVTDKKTNEKKGRMRFLEDGTIIIQDILAVEQL